MNKYVKVCKVCNKKNLVIKTWHQNIKKEAENMNWNMILYINLYIYDNNAFAVLRGTY